MGEQDSDQAKEADEARETDEQDSDSDSREPATEKPEPDDEDKEKAAEMMEAYKERPTLILPGTGGAVSGTAVGNWLDDDGNPKSADDKDGPAAKAKSGDNEIDTKDIAEQAAKDKEFNEAVIKDAKEREGGAERDEKSDEEQDEKSDDEQAVST